jgi:hypothetical protein
LALLVFAWLSFLGTQTLPFTWLFTRNRFLHQFAEHAYHTKAVAEAEVSAPVDVPDFQWVKVIGRPQYSFADGHAHLLVKAYSVVPIKAPKDSMLY